MRICTCECALMKCVRGFMKHARIFQICEMVDMIICIEMMGSCQNSRDCYSCYEMCVCVTMSITQLTLRTKENYVCGEIVCVNEPGGSIKCDGSWDVQINYDLHVVTKGGQFTQHDIEASNDDISVSGMHPD